MGRWVLRPAGLALALLSLAFQSAVAQEARPIEGHENWKLGMSMAEALAAEPRAERHECDGSTCLHYADRRFSTADIAVSARFDASDALDVIVVTMAVKPVETVENLCRRVYTQLAAFYTAAHGETLPVSRDAWIWSSPDASLTLLSRCGPGEDDVVNILVEAVDRPAD